LESVVWLFISTVGTISQNNISVVRIVCPLVSEWMWKWFVSGKSSKLHKWLLWPFVSIQTTQGHTNHHTPTFTQNASVEIVQNGRPSLQLENMIS